MRQLEQKFGVHATIVPNGIPEANGFTPHDEREYFLWVGLLDEDQK
jgi:hypothetical protein